jgi:DNA-binding HxlR family transcriptional regulator
LATDNLEKSGLIERRVLPGRPPGVEYKLTESGRGFRRVAKAIETWAHGMAAAAPHRPAARTGGRSR